MSPAINNCRSLDSALAVPSIWRASELAVGRVATIGTGHKVVDEELPDSGWPRSSLIELLVQRDGIGEVQLLRPALVQICATKRVVLIQPPFLPHAMTFRSWDVGVDQVLWIKAGSSADSLWAAEQILKSGSCGAVILWARNIRPDSLRRLNLAAQSAEVWLWLVRPLAAAVDSSPAPLRLGLRPAAGGISVDIVKRRGPQSDYPIFVPLTDMPAGRQPIENENETDVEHSPTITAARSTAAALV